MAVYSFILFVFSYWWSINDQYLKLIIQKPLYASIRKELMIVDDLTLSTFPIYISTNFWNTNLYIKYIQSSNLMNQHFATSSLAKNLSRCLVTCFEHCTNRCLIYSCQVFGSFANLHACTWSLDCLKIAHIIYVNNAFSLQLF